MLERSGITGPLISRRTTHEPEFLNVHRWRPGGRLLFLVPTAHGQAPAKPRLDLFGDPLPEYAVARLGCMRLRHLTEIEHLAFSPDGKRLVSWGGRAARLWDVATSKLVREIPTLDTWPDFQFAVYSPDGKWLAGRTQSGVVLYDTNSGKQERGFELASNKLSRSFLVQFTPDSKFLAAASSEGAAVWDVCREAAERQVLPPKTEPFALHLAADGKTLTVLSEGNLLSWWDVAEGRLRKKQEGIVKDGIRHATFSPGGTLVAFLGEESLRVLDLANDKIVFQLPGKTQHAGLPSFSADGKHLLASSVDRWLVWEVGSWKLRFAVPRDKEGSYHATLSPDGKMIAATEQWGSISLRNLATGKERFPGRPPVSGLYEMVWASATALVTRPWDSHASVTRWDGLTGRWLGGGPKIPLECSWAVLRPQGDLLALSEGKYLGLWDVHSGKEKRKLSQGNKEQYSHLGACAGQHTNRRIWCCPTGVAENAGGPVHPSSLRVNTGKEVRSLTLPPDVIGRSLALSPDNRTVLVQCDARKSGMAYRPEWHFWNSATGSLRRLPLPNLLYADQQATFSPDGRLVAICGLSPDEDWMLRGTALELQVFEVITGGRLWHFPLPVKGKVQNTENRTSPVFTPDGQTLLVGRDDRVHFWDVGTGKQAPQSVAQPRRRHRQSGPRLMAAARDRRRGCPRTHLGWTPFVQPPTCTRALDGTRTANVLEGPGGARCYRGPRQVATAAGSAGSGHRLAESPPAADTIVEGRRGETAGALADPRFKVREQGTAALLQRLQPAVTSPGEGNSRNLLPLEARRALRILRAKVDPDAITPEVLRGHRAIAVLETIATPAARELLRTLADFSCHLARLTQEVK